MSTSNPQPVMASADDRQLDPLERRRRIRRTGWLLAAVALTFYFGFIAMSIWRGTHMP